MENNNTTPLQPNVDTSYLQPIVIEPELQKINLDVKAKALPYAKQGGSASTGIPSTIDELQNMNADTRQKGIDYSTQYSEVYDQLSSGDSVARYSNFMPGIDNNERLASRQTTGEKWANGATKALAKTGSAIVGGTAGLIYGVGAAINDGSFSSIYDNSFSNTLADWDTKLGYQLPNLYTKQEQEKGLFGQMGTANFWSDKFLGGLSFTAGAIISEGIWAYATGGLSLSSMGARLGTKTVGRWGIEALGETAALQGLTKYKGLYKTMLEGSVQAGKVSKRLANNLGKAGELASTVGVLARSAGYEASVEALQFKREAEENFFQNFRALNGREPNPDEVGEFKSHNESAANTVFGVNMAILMPSNLVTMGHILDIKSPIKTGFTSFIDKKAFGYGIEKTTDEAGKAVYKTLEATTGQKVARNVFNYAIKPSLAEGLFEEGLQGVTTKTANKWVEHTYDPKHSNANLDTMGAFYESLGEQYGTKEGWVENGLGMIIGIVGGATNARSENKQKAEELSYQADVATTFQTSNLQSIVMPNRLQSANRMAGFSEDARVEAQKGNISKSALAQKSALLTFINSKMVMGEGISDMLSEVKLSLDSTTEEQWKDAGVEKDKIDDYKAESLKDFETLAKDWKANKTYWGYMIGQKIVGEDKLDTDIAGDINLGSKTGAIIEALAWQSTIGEVANQHMKDAQDVIARELGVEYSGAVDLQSKLKTQKIEVLKQIMVDTSTYKVELLKRDKLVARIAKLNAMPKEPASPNKPAGKQAGILSQALLETEARLAELKTQLNGHAEELNKQTAYTEELGAVDFSTQKIGGSAITGDDLVSLKDNLKKFETTLERLKTTNPQRHSYLDGLLKEYSDSEEVFLQNQVTQRVISHPDFKIEKINSWIQGKFKGNKSMNLNTQEWMTDTLETYKKGKISGMALQANATLAEEKEARIAAIKEELNSIEDPESPRIKELQAELDNLEKTEEEVEIPEDKGEVKPKAEPIVEEDSISQVDAYKKRISEALKKNHNYLSYMGDNYDDVANKKPTSEEVEEFKKLREEKAFDDEKYKELQQKLSDWKLLDSAVDEEYVSLGDLIVGIEQLEQEVEESETLDEITPEQAPDTADNEGIQASSNAIRYDILQNTNGAITVKRDKQGNFTLHHLKLASIASKLGSEFTLVDKDGNSIFFGEETPGSVLTVEGVEFKVIAGNAIEVKESDFMPLQEKLNMYPLNTGASSWSYSDIYTKVGDEFVKLNSDFKDNTINSERIYELKEGEKLAVTLNNDGYNDKLFSEYENAKGKEKAEALKRLRENLKLNATTTSGIIENVSILKALRGEIDENFTQIRDRAFTLYMAAFDKSNVKLGIEVEVGGIFLGSPRFSLTNEGKTDSRPITERGAKEVKSTGYILNGELVTSREVNNINKTFVGQLSKKNKDKKIPVVIVQRGNHNVAFPVSMVKTSQDLSGTFDSILAMRISAQEKVRKINQAIQDNNIETAKLAYEDVNNQEKLDSTRKAFESKLNFVTADDFASKDYDIKNITKDATSTIDLTDIDNVFQDAKLRIKLDESIKYTTSKELKMESLAEVEKQINDIAIKLYRDLYSNAKTKYVDSTGKILEHTHYIQTFDNYKSSINLKGLDINSPNVTHQENENVLREAFVSLSPSIKNILGSETVAEVNYLFKLKDNIKKYTTPDVGDIKSGLNNSSC